MVLELNDLIVGLILTTIIPILYCVYHVSRSKSKSLPPAYKGWFPWLGCAFEFGKNPLDFIAQKKELGRIFTLYVAGERLTFITDAEDFQYFFQSPFVDFQKAVQDPVLNVASVSKTSFFKYHTKIHDMVKGRLASSRLIYFSDKLCDEFRDQLTQLGKQGKGDLHHLVRRSMYAAVINNLFGKNVLPVNCEKEFEKIEEMFVMFDEQFEYGARLPSVFLKDWSSAKKYLIELFSKVVQKTTNKKSDDDETLLQSLLSLVQDQYKANYSLLLLWASLANAIPDMKIPEGDMLMLSPYWAHRNEKYFPDPLMYKPERWKEADIDKNVFLDGFVAFGGGRYQCPGRWYAILEIQMYVAMFIQMFDCKLLINSVPEPSKKHLVGTQQPAEPCPVEYRLRK
ncbi:24-hydroxycholesterol 7-alpha-hydroxylase-like isoform X2 [Mytilus californianus]|uniref:24-hydroxycholesterol 7-alpha-hydroxylase-like isoform X2 n=1 Tax=Mytilus californianus TaxID=6549 RepID=UPI002245BF72|nr:24-hydroxycholesterol 7-alpha-hydroxylase-like isoform X2 [Mytilus californianus]